MYTGCSDVGLSYTYSAGLVATWLLTLVKCVSDFLQFIQSDFLLLFS